MTAARKLEYATPEEYLAAERNAVNKHELIDGRILAMAGATGAHSFLATRINAFLVSRVGDDCLVGDSDLRIKNEPRRSYMYADGVVVCGSPSYEDDQRQDVLTNPSLVVEVLSVSTEAYDRGIKAGIYRGIESLHTLVFVSQWDWRVEWQERHADGSWRLQEAVGEEGLVRFSHLGIEIRLAELYRNITLSEPPPIPEERA